MDGIAGLLTQGTNLSIWMFVALCGVSFLGSFIAAALGLGGGLLILATMAMVLPPAVRIPVHGVVQLGSNFGRVMLLVRQVLYLVVPAFLAGTLIGATVGTHVVVSLPKWLLLGVLASFVLYGTWAPGFRGAKPGPAKFFALGAVSTFISMFVGGTGPLIAPFAAVAGTHRQQVVADPRHADVDPAWLQGVGLRSDRLRLRPLRPLADRTSGFWISRDLLRPGGAGPVAGTCVPQRA